MDGLRKAAEREGGIFQEYCIRECVSGKSSKCGNNRKLSRGIEGTAGAGLNPEMSAQKSWSNSAGRAAPPEGRRLRNKCHLFLFSGNAAWPAELPRLSVSNLCFFIPSGNLSFLVEFMDVGRGGGRTHRGDIVVHLDPGGLERQWQLLLQPAVWRVGGFFQLGFGLSLIHI